MQTTPTTIPSTLSSASAASPLYHPPRPRPLAELPALLRTIWQGDGNLLSLLPRDVYEVDAGWVGYSRRSILIVNTPLLTKPILTDPLDIFPKNDLMVGALAPLVGESMFVSHGDHWRQQRRMVDPAFSHMRLAKAFPAMDAAMDDFEAKLTTDVAHARPVSLDRAMSELTADIICRTVFSRSLENETARDVCESFSFFERSVAHVELKRLIFGKPFSDIKQKPDVAEACRRIRGHVGAMLDGHLAKGANFDDIANAVIAAKDPADGKRFTREELIDQLGVFFLAGHETTASALIWAFFIAAEQPDIAHRVRAEVQAVCGDDPIGFEQLRKLEYTKNVFKEALRLYPPITFLPRVAAENTEIGRFKVKRGAMIMIAPWTIHRHRKLWRNPDAFDPDRFSADRADELVQGAYLPFGSGPRVCVGAAFATLEATLILARLLRRFSFDAIDPHKVQPVARLTTRPAQEVLVRVKALA